MSQIVKDVMHPGVVTIPASLTIGEVAQRMVAQRIHALFVENNEGKVAGVIADTDLLAGEWLFSDQESLNVLRAMTAGELMSTPVASIDVSATVKDVAQQMIRQHISRLLVTEGGKPTGVISISDIVRSLSSQPIARHTVQEAMSRAIVICRLDTPLTAVARSMSERHSRAVVVVESNGKTRGIITGTDLLPYAGNNSVEGLTAADLMHDPITIAPSASLREAADQMIRHHIHRLLVVDPAQHDAIPMGLISTSDVIHEMAQPGSAWQF